VKEYGIVVDCNLRLHFGASIQESSAISIICLVVVSRNEAKMKE
jgi:hypothetical protein